MDLQALFLQTILTVAPPGYTKFSVTPVECPTACLEDGEEHKIISNQSDTSGPDECVNYQWSSFYNSCVRKETAEEGRARYDTISNSLISTGKIKLCLDDNLNPVPDCKRSPLFRGMKFIEMVSLEGAAMIAESGIREDVQVGRGRSGKPSDDGGQGLGPGGEVCLVQIHPLVLAKFNLDPQTFIGSNQEALNNCFGFGMDLLGRARGMCAWQAAKTPELEHNWVFETFSAYGTGSTCQSANNGKTAYRTALYEKISADFGARIKKEKRREKRLENRARAAADSPTLPMPPPTKT